MSTVQKRTDQFCIFIGMVIIAFLHWRAQFAVLNQTVINVTNVLLSLDTVLNRALVLWIVAVFDVFQDTFKLCTVRGAALWAIIIPEFD